MSEMDDLAAFAMLVEANSFTLAAQWLDTSTSQLSKRISKLEKSYGVTLLHRTTRSLTLTSAGAILLPEARALLMQRDRVRDAMAYLSESLSGTVRLTVPVSLGETFFEGLLTEFSETYPQLQVELDLNNNFRDMRRDGFDLGIRSSVGVDERLVAKPLLAMQELTCASPAYLEQFGKPQTPEDLRSHRCLLNSHYSGRESWVYHQNHELHRVPVKGMFASNHYDLLKRAALAGTGIARLPSYMIHNELDDGCLHWLLRDYQTPISSLFLVHPFEGQLPRRTQVMADYLTTWFERSSAALAKL
ncbi:MAG TPA: LysR family transcriptional regulator [Pseudomonas sp.]|uniref:LysR family transcriptional regulator n=1 Tax=Pseudomonas sp. TaxID=306 RepID=UPI002EDA2857